MGIEDLVNKGKELFEENKDKIEGLLKSDKAEEISDQALDSAADLAKKIAPDSADATVDAVRDNVDKAVGSE